MNTTELSDHPRAIVTWLYAEFMNGGDPAVAGLLVAPSFSGPAGEGPEGFAAALLPLRRAFPDLHFTIHDLVVEGSLAAVRWSWEGTHTGSFSGISPTGRRVSNHGIAIYRVERGRITEAWSQMDRLGVLQQIGALTASFTAAPQSPATHEASSR